MPCIFTHLVLVPAIVQLLTILYWIRATGFNMKLPNRDGMERSKWFRFPKKKHDLISSMELLREHDKPYDIWLVGKPFGELFFEEVSKTNKRSHGIQSLQPTAHRAWLVDISANHGPRNGLGPGWQVENPVSKYAKKGRNLSINFAFRVRNPTKLNKALTVAKFFSCIIISLDYIGLYQEWEIHHKK